MRQFFHSFSEPKMTSYNLLLFVLSRQQSQTQNDLIRVMIDKVQKFTGYG